MVVPDPPPLAKPSVPATDAFKPSTGVAVYAGAAAEPVLLPNTVPAAAFANANVPVAAMLAVKTVPSATFTPTPLLVGSVKVGVAVLAGAVIVNLPDAVELAKAIVPVDVPGMPSTGAMVYPGAAAEAVALPNTVPAAALLKLNESAGVVVAVATDVVNRGLRFPALKDVTVPVGADPLEAAVIKPLALTVMLAYVNEPTLEFTVAKVKALEPEVVASPLISDAVKGLPPRTMPVSVLPVAVPPFAMGTTENEAVGAEPAPPPSTKSPAGKTAEDAHVDAEEKYGIPPEVPATVSAGVVVGVATEIKPPVKDTLVTVPSPNPEIAAATNAVVASLVDESPGDCVVAVMPFASAATDKSEAAG